MLMYRSLRAYTVSLSLSLSLSLSELFLRVRWKRLHKVGEQDSHAATVVPEEEKILHIAVWCSSV
jgi:hypothetical protein